jgi:hypothetical protein
MTGRDSGFVPYEILWCGAGVWRNRESGQYLAAARGDSAAVCPGCVKRFDFVNRERKIAGIRLSFR